MTFFIVEITFIAIIVITYNCCNYYTLDEYEHLFNCNNYFEML